jgi:hypothetical protein
VDLLDKTALEDVFTAYTSEPPPLPDVATQESDASTHCCCPGGTLTKVVLRPAGGRAWPHCRFDVVVHFAGLKAVGESVAKPMYYYENNIVSTLNLLDIMGRKGPKAVRRPRLLTRFPSALLPPSPLLRSPQQPLAHAQHPHSHADGHVTAPPAI